MPDWSFKQSPADLWHADSLLFCPYCQSYQSYWHLLWWALDLTGVLPLWKSLADW